MFYGVAVLFADPNNLVQFFYIYSQKLCDSEGVTCFPEMLYFRGAWNIL